MTDSNHQKLTNHNSIKDSPSHQSQKSEFLIAILSGVAYGVIAQLNARLGFAKDIFIVMSFTYVFILPFVLGFIAIDRSQPKHKKSVASWIIRPIVVVLVCMLTSFIVGWEGTICLVMALPVYLPMGILGGVIAGLIHRKKHQVYMILCMPLVLGPVEAYYTDLPQETRTVHTSITLQATPKQVWPHIIRVRPIHEAQQGFFYKMGFPKPLEATLSHEGIGGVREAKFERGLTFFETIIEWIPLQKIRFKIKAHPDTVPITTLDPHVVPGGAFFEALEGSYEIVVDSQNPTQLTLNLTSHYRLSTQFNFYASWWGDWLMSDIQNNILNVLQQRINPKS
jgi:hypothetical protein